MTLFYSLGPNIGTHLLLLITPSPGSSNFTTTILIFVFKKAFNNPFKRPLRLKKYNLHFPAKDILSPRPNPLLLFPRWDIWQKTSERRKIWNFLAKKWEFAGNTSFFSSLSISRWNWYRYLATKQFAMIPSTTLLSWNSILAFSRQTLQGFSLSGNLFI